MKTYNEATEERKKNFEALKAKDEKNANEIDHQMAKIQKISDQISQIKGPNLLFLCTTLIRQVIT